VKNIVKKKYCHEMKPNVYHESGRKVWLTQV